MKSKKRYENILFYSLITTLFLFAIFSAHVGNKISILQQENEDLRQKLPHWILEVDCTTLDTGDNTIYKLTFDNYDTYQTELEAALKHKDCEVLK